MAAGPAGKLMKFLEGRCRIIDLEGHLLLPGLVNAHAHLDLTGIGAVDYEGDFIGWVKNVRRMRATESGIIRESVREGARLSLEAGVVRVGDIAGSAEAHQAMVESDLAGVSFLELFGLGDRTAGEAMNRLLEMRAWEMADRPVEKVILGLQPHAPYSAGANLYKAAAELASRMERPLCTHLAETMGEMEFTAGATGPFRELLESIGKWEEWIAGGYSEGLHPVEWLSRLSLPGRILCAHCNYAGKREAGMLRRMGATVAYCPRASEYFGHEGHPYRMLLDAGVNVCLGTDSILCHGTLSILDEMRLLHRRDETHPDLLLAMGTINGLVGLGIEPLHGTLTPGARPGLIAMEFDVEDPRGPLEQVMSGEGKPRLLERVW